MEPPSNNHSPLLSSPIADFERNKLDADSGETWPAMALADSPSTNISSDQAAEASNGDRSQEPDNKLNVPQITLHPDDGSGTQPREHRNELFMPESKGERKGKEPAADFNEPPGYPEAELGSSSSVGLNGKTEQNGASKSTALGIPQVSRPTSSIFTDDSNDHHGTSEYGQPNSETRPLLDATDPFEVRRENQNQTQPPVVHIDEEPNSHRSLQELIDWAINWGRNLGRSLSTTLRLSPESKHKNSPRNSMQDSLQPSSEQAPTEVSIPSAVDLPSGYGAFACAAWAPNGQYFATATSRPNFLFFWSRTSKGWNRRRLAGHIHEINHMIFSQSDPLLLAAWSSSSPVMMLYGPKYYKGLHTLESGYAPGPICDASFSPDGKLLVCTSRDGLQVWDVRPPGMRLHLLDTRPSNLLSFLSDKSQFVFASTWSGRSDSVRLYSGAKGKKTERKIKEMKDIITKPSEAKISALAFSQAGTLLVSDTSGHIEMYSEGHSTKSETAFTPYAEKATFAKREDTVALSLRNEGILFMTANLESRLGYLTVEQVRREVDSSQPQEVSQSIAAQSCTISPDCMLVAYWCFEDCIVVWSVRTQSIFATFAISEKVMTAMFSPNSNALLVAFKSGTVKLCYLPRPSETSLGN